MGHLIEIRNLRKTYLIGDEEVHALDDVSATIENGEFVAIMGASGSGKSTMLNILGCLDTPTSGSYLLDGTEVARRSAAELAHIRNEKLGFVFQNFNLFPQYTALQNVMLAKELLAKEQPDYKERKKEIHAEIQKQAEGLLIQMGLKDRMGNYPHQLSGGQCQRVAIARALALQPDILCFDEPTSALDPELTGEVLKVIRELADNKTTMIIVTHEMAFARDVANHVVFMDDGHILEQGDPIELFEHPKEERTKQFLSRFSQDEY